MITRMKGLNADLRTYNGKSNDEIRGSFAPLRMTTKKIAATTGRETAKGTCEGRRGKYAMSMGDGKSAVLLLAHGTPDVLGEMAEYLSKVTGGRALPQAVVEELQHRYAQIGLREVPGTEAPPLTKWTMTQGHMLEQALGEKVYVAMRNWHPYIADVVAQMRMDGVTHIKTICLAPQNSRTSVGLYRRAVLAAAAGLEVGFVAGWAESPLLAQADRKSTRLNSSHRSLSRMPSSA